MKRSYNVNQKSGDPKYSKSSWSHPCTDPYANHKVNVNNNLNDGDRHQIKWNYGKKIFTALFTLLCSPVSHNCEALKNKAMKILYNKSFQE